jgi:hypothetical protein
MARHTAVPGTAQTDYDAYHRLDIGPASNVVASMAEDLNKLAGNVSTAVRETAGRFRRTSLFVKIALLAIASAVVAIAQFSEFDLATGPSKSEIAGIIAALVVAIGAIFVIITEEDAPRQLAIAQDAIEAARAAEARYDAVGELDEHIERLIALYNAQNVMRGVIEQQAAAGSLAEDRVVMGMMRAARRLLPIAMRFAQNDQWTIGIYKAVPSSEAAKFDLKCLAHHRAIECDPSEARVWREGTGIAGVCFTNGGDIIIPDLHAEGMRSVFGTAANEPRPYDSDRYRSMVAFPVKVQGLGRPWGVVTATSDRVGHFSAAEMRGLKPEEGARALSNMVALAVAVARKCATSSTEVGDSDEGTR